MISPSNGSARRRRRLLAIAFGLGLLAAIELLLRGIGFGAPGHRPDPFAGFAASEPLFVREVGPAGEIFFRTRDDRVGPFHPSRFTAVKPPGTIRIFCLGGSATYGFPLVEELAFCSVLGDALDRSHPEYHFEMINCGGMSYGSRRVLNVMRELTRYDADAFIIHMGHNEYLERRFFAPFLTEPPWRRALRGGLNKVRLYVALQRFVVPLIRSRPTPANDPYGVGPDRDDSQRLPRNPREDELVRQQFAFAVDEIAALAAESGVPLILVNPGTNLRGWPPEASDWRHDLPEAEERRRDAAVARGRGLQQRGGHEAALRFVDEALSIDPGVAEVLFLRARILDGLGRFDEARLAFESARDRDAVPIRITSDLESIIQETWLAHRLLPADAQDALSRASPQGIVDDEMILDYCHPSEEGHRRIAALLHTVTQRALWPAESPRPLDRTALTARSANGAGSAFGTAWRGQMLLRQGRLKEALPLFRRALEMDPELATAHEGLGRALAMSGRVQEGIAELEQATRLDPDAATGWNNLGRAHVVAGHLDDAVVAFHRSLETGTGTGVTRVNLADVFLRLGRLEEAEAQIRAALDESPASAPAWTILGEVAAHRGDSTAAAEAFRTALDLDPDFTRARDGLARLGADAR